MSAVTSLNLSAGNRDSWAACARLISGGIEIRIEHVDAGDAVTRGHEPLGGVRADEPGRTGDDDVHGRDCCAAVPVSQVSAAAGSALWLVAHAVEHVQRAVLVVVARASGRRSSKSCRGFVERDRGSRYTMAAVLRELDAASTRLDHAAVLQHRGPFARAGLASGADVVDWECICLDDGSSDGPARWTPGGASDRAISGREVPRRIAGGAPHGSGARAGAGRVPRVPGCRRLVISRPAGTRGPLARRRSPHPGGERMRGGGQRRARAGRPAEAAGVRLYPWSRCSIVSPRRSSRFRPR